MPIQTVEQLEAIYGTEVSDASTVKEVDRIIEPYARLIEASPFVTLATCGPEGLDCSPRGDGPGFVRVLDDRTLALPDRRGNNRIDSLRNIVRDPRVALLFLIPGSGTTLRLNGRAVIDDDADLLQSFAVDGKAPRTALVVTVGSVYFQCARAIIRSALWNPERHVAPGSIPSPGDILAAASSARIDGEAYDREWPERAARSLW